MRNKEAWFRNRFLNPQTHRFLKVAIFRVSLDYVVDESIKHVSVGSDLIEDMDGFLLQVFRTMLSFAIELNLDQFANDERRGVELLLEPQDFLIGLQIGSAEIRIFDQYPRHSSMSKNIGSLQILPDDAQYDRPASFFSVSGGVGSLFYEDGLIGTISKGVDKINQAGAGELLTAGIEKFSIPFEPQYPVYSATDFLQGSWSFWNEWHQGFLDGKPLDWELQRRVALIDDAIWEAGPEAVAAEIEKIRAEFAIEKYPQAEEVYQNDDGFYDVREVEVDLSALLDEVLSRTQFAFDLAISSNQCDLNDLCMAAKWLRYSFENCREQPNALEQNLRMARDVIVSKLGEGEYQKSDTLDVLVRVLDEAALQLRADHPEVSQAVGARTKERLRAIDDEKRVELAKRMAAVGEEAAPRLGNEFKLDAETVDAGDGVEAQAEAIKRSGNRSGKISLLERAKKTESSGGMAATKIAMRAQSLLDLITSLF